MLLQEQSLTNKETNTDKIESTVIACLRQAGKRFYFLINPIFFVRIPVRQSSCVRRIAPAGWQFLSPLSFFLQKIKLLYKLLYIYRNMERDIPPWRECVKKIQLSWKGLDIMFFSE
jgi:hypothetical protein